MAYSELIKSFGRIRDYMRQFYVYGFRSREEFDQKSARSYDNERRRIKSWLGGYMDFRQAANGRRVFISVDSRQVSRNPLYRAFKAKSFTDMDIVLHFCILDLLSDGGEYTARDIIDSIEAVLPDDSTVRKKLIEYEKMGILVSEKKGRELFYRLSGDDIAPDTWRDALDFYSECGQLGVVGSYLSDRLEPDEGIFRFKHHYILKALESEILYALVCAMTAKSRAELTMVSRDGDEPRRFIVTPLRIRVSVQEGRYYVLAWDGGDCLYRPFRLDRIQTVKKLDADSEYDMRLEGLGEFTAHLWGASTGDSLHTQHIEMTLHADDDEPHILQRLVREKRCGKVEVIDKNTMRFTADVYDAQELLPWIRTFTGRIVSLECSDGRVTEKFMNDFNAVMELYGGDGDAVQ